MPIFRDIVMTWKGAEYTVSPSLRLMRSIEMGDISLADIAVRTLQGKPPLSLVATVVQKMLNSAGVSVTDEEVYVELMSGNQDAVRRLIDHVLFAFSPQVEDGKNPAAPSAS